MLADGIQTTKRLSQDAEIPDDGDINGPTARRICAAIMSRCWGPHPHPAATHQHVVALWRAGTTYPWRAGWSPRPDRNDRKRRREMGATPEDQNAGVRRLPRAFSGRS